MEYPNLDLEALREIELNPGREWRIYLAAQEYIKCGYHLLPIVRNGKALPRKDYNVNYGSASRKKATIERWFHPETGRFKGWNIGLACGKEGGIFAVDVDVRDEVNGFHTLAKLEELNHELPASPTQRTPKGGEHYLFRWQPNASNTTDKIGPGIDTRGGTENACKGHIVVWPSEVDGHQYKWVSGGEIPDVPSWIMERMGVLWQPTAYGKGGRGNENVGEDDYEKIIPEEQILRMLSHIPIDSLDYDSWLKVGMSIKSQYPESDGLDLWDSWSQEGSRYKANECRIRWNGFSTSGTVRAGTLFYFAKEGGYEVDPLIDEVKGNKFDELVADMNQEYAVISIGGKLKILREKVLDDQSFAPYDLLDKDSFRTLLQNRIMFIENAKGVAKPIPVADIWLGHEARRTYPNGMGLYPNDAPSGYYNTWKGFSVNSRSGTCEAFLDHVKVIICGGDEKLNEWVLDWMADLVQFPDDPKGCAIVMTGDEGTGKGTFANAIGELFGCHYRHLIDESHLTGNFNAHLMDAIVVFADEITWGGNKKTAGKLKGMVTESRLIGERKGVDALIYRNMVHVLIASNDRWVVPAGGNSRRWLVLDVPDTRIDDVAYFDTIKDEMENGGREALLYLLLSREITNNLRRAPETAVLQEQRMLSAQHDTILSWWCMALIGGRIETNDEREFEPGRDTPTDWPANVDKTRFYVEYEDWCLKRRKNPKGMNLFCKEIKPFGVVSARITVGKERKRVFAVPDLERARATFNNKHKGMLTELEENDDEE